MMWFILILLLLGFWMWMIVDCALCEKGAFTRIAWLVFLVPFGPPVSLIYYLVRALPRVIVEAHGEENVAA